MKKHYLRHAWVILGIYGIWFAVFSGLEEVLAGKYWKFSLSLLLSMIFYFIIELKIYKK